MAEIIDRDIQVEYEIIKKIKAGGYGHVWKVKQKKTGKVYALKKIPGAFENQTDAVRTYRQISFLKRLDHPNIMRLIKVFLPQNQLDIYMLFEYMDEDLTSVSLKTPPLQDSHKRYIIYQIALALRYIHRGEAIHRDIKPANILINSNYNIKLCDFGLARTLARLNDVQLTDFVSTKWYRSPQILLGSTCYGKESDMWSLGCLIGELYKGKPMFPGTSTINQLERIINFTGAPTQIDIKSLKTFAADSLLDSIKIPIIYEEKWLDECSDEVQDLINNLLQINPNKRLSIDEVLSHPFLGEYAEYKPLPKIQPFFIDRGERFVSQHYRTMIQELVKNMQPAKKQTGYVGRKYQKAIILQTSKEPKKRVYTKFEAKVSTFRSKQLTSNTSSQAQSPLGSPRLKLQLKDSYVKADNKNSQNANETKATFIQSSKSKSKLEEEQSQEKPVTIFSIIGLKKSNSRVSESGYARRDSKNMTKVPQSPTRLKIQKRLSKQATPSPKIFSLNSTRQFRSTISFSMNNLLIAKLRPILSPK